MSAVLRVVNGPRAGEQVKVRSGEVLSVGRSGESDLQLLGLGVSRFHCVLEEHGGELVIADLNSSNGTFVNGQRVKRQPVRQGDEIEVGTIKLVVDQAPQRRGAAIACSFTESSGEETRVYPVAKLTEALEQVAAQQADGGLRRYLIALDKVYKALSAEERSGRLMNVLMDAVLEVIRAERGFLLLMDREGGVRPYVARVAPWSGSDLKLPLSRGVIRQCIEQKASVFSRNVRAQEREPSSAQEAAEQLRCAICAPLESGGRVLGALYLDTGLGKDTFDEQDMELLSGVARHAGLALHRAELVDDLERLVVGAIETLVAALEAKDIYTYGHSARVAKLGRRIAEGMGLAEDDQEKVKLAGLLHDIGKIGIPEAVLSQRGRLTEDEWAYMRSHPQIGESIIRQMGSERVTDLCHLVRHHHERLDGSGYPDGLVGEAIPLGARILSVADAYDAMRSNRPYRAPFSAREAIAELRGNAGRQFDAQAIEALAELRSEARPAAGAEEG